MILVKTMVFDDEDIFEEMKRLHKEMAKMERIFSQAFGQSDGQPSSQPFLPPTGAPGDDSIWDGQDEKQQRKQLSPYRVPATDLVETESGFLAAIELPGVEKKDISLNVTETAIEVRVDRKHEQSVEDKEKDVIRHSSVSKQFYRRFPLPKPVIPEKATAELRQGILRVEVPKAENGRGSHRVDIK